ncbi:MAG: DNA-binding response regulator [Micavibrio sp.]|nr:DNA-binding response regulator [Micavibrio sp.]|tara:strand:+ start:1923 stop:2627 length:705 start_codon:yes stop_codon:yes gene_type:complete
MPYYAEKPHILVIDDDDRIRDLLQRFLAKQDYVVSCAENAQQAKEILAGFEYDLLVLDVMMPGQSGFDFLVEMREKGSDLPVILLTAKGEPADRIEGLTIGADDYLVKPFEPKELLLRIQAILKRAHKYKASAQKDVRIGDWLYDREQGVLQKDDGENVALTNSEKQLCEMLIQKANNPVARYDLAEKLGLLENERSIDVQITRLRKKLGDDSKVPRYLKTVRGQGYLLRVDDV